MTEKQAYKILTNTPIRSQHNHAEYSKALHIAIGALDKQIPKRCASNPYDAMCVYCPTCNCGFGIYISQPTPYCPQCGQALMFGGDTNG